MPLQLFLYRTVIDYMAFELNLVTDISTTVRSMPLMGWVGLTAGVLALNQLIQPFTATFQSLIGDRLTGHVTERLIETVNTWGGIARFEDPGWLDDLQRARTHTARGALDLVLYGSQMGVTVFTVVSLTLILVAVSPILPLLIVLATLPQMARQWEYGQTTGSHLYWKTADARRLEYMRAVQLAPEPAKDVRLYDLGPFFQQKYRHIFTHNLKTLDQLRYRLARLMTLSSMLAAAVTGAVYVYIVWLIKAGQLSIGDLALYGMGAVMLQAKLLSLGAEVAVFPRVFHFLPSLFRVLNAPPDLSTPPQPKPVPKSAWQEIVFEQVCFTYPGQTTPILQNVSFSIKQGESLALVGRNGAGKTTIVKLLLRLYDPTGGRILIDGVDLTSLDLTDFRRQISVIFQDFVRYELTTAENIGLGNIDALLDQEKILKAADQAGADQLLRELPQGLATPLGREFGGRELSGGEWQKLALARAFMRPSQLLILDEPTAALDVQTEYDVYLRFHQLTKNRTTLLISHRFSTVRMADRIIFLGDGAIQETGSHAELIALNGEYANLYTLQAAQYGVNDDTAKQDGSL